MRDAAMARTMRRLAVEAGAAIMEIRACADFGVQTKGDDSPVTRADLAADAILCDGLAAAFPDIPAVTEERPRTHATGGMHFLIDPLDGTREFIRRSGDFTVNIALVDDGAPVAGVVHAPAAGRLFMTVPGGGAVEETGGFDPDVPGPTRAIRVSIPSPGALRAVASRSHMDPATEAYLARLAPAALRSAGSSLKFCLIATGEADVYPRFGPTMHWDTAAAHAVLNAAGGRVLRLPGLAPLRYDAPDRRNPAFVACAAGWTPPAP